jgi:hypothetical protein
MKTVMACCAVLAFACCEPAAAAPPNAFNPFDSSILRPPASVPHGRGVRAATAPLPRPKPVSAPRTAPAPGASLFPPVTPLE